MLGSIKSKLIVITLGIFIIFNIAVLSIQASSYFNFKALKIEHYTSRVEEFAKYIIYYMNQLETNAQALAIDGAAFNYFDIDDDYLNFVTMDNFKNNNKIALGGGLWFEPNIINNKKRYCSYAIWKNGNVVLDEDCKSESYDYQSQAWYANVKKSYTPEKKDEAFWSAPYYDKIGNNDLMVTSSNPIYDKEGKFVGLATVDWSLESINDKIINLTPSKKAKILFADKKHDFIISFVEEQKVIKDLVGKSLKDVSWYSENLKDSKNIVINSVKYRTFLKEFYNGMVLIVNVPLNDIYGKQKRKIYYGLLVELIGTVFLALIIYVVLTKYINQPISLLVKGVNEIGQGNFDKKIEIKKPKEFLELANTINKMTSDIKQYLENIKNLTLQKMQIEADLDIAREIQISSLPTTFPPFPDVISVNLFAGMKTAKQVGGDFYDFYFIDYKHIAFTIADVSGKGIPAALFMMRAKALLKSIALEDLTPEDIIQKVNNSICDNNEQGYFVTVGFGVIDITTGEVTYVNAGHNPPIIKTQEKTTYLEVPKNIVLGVLNDFSFKVYNFTLRPLETLFLYTDGVTEATNKEFNLYGEKKLLDTVIKQESNPEKIIKAVFEDVEKYADGFEQSDDITMFGITYLGNENMIEKIKVIPQVKELKTLISWLEDLCTKCNIGDSQLSKILISAEEIFVNIAYYAYPNKPKDKTQDITITFKHIKPLDEIHLIFADSGIEYNPLLKEDPDINLKADERTAGGLGVYMVKKMMDEVEYEYKNKQNILSLKLKINN